MKSPSAEPWRDAGPWKVEQQNAMKIPEVVVFDLGKVLVDFDYGLSARQISAHSNVSPIEIERVILHTPLLSRYETGELTTQKFFEEIQQQTGFRASLEEFGNMFADIFSPIDPMIEMQSALRAKGIPTFIFSNTNELAVSHIQRNFPFFSGFNGYVYSFEHGAMKPDHPLYEVVESMTGRKGEAILYLDDRPENIETGQARGWQTIHHQSADASCNFVRQLGLLDGHRES